LAKIFFIKITLNVAVTPPAQRVQFILGEDVDDGMHEPHPLFAEMGELVHDGNDMEWKETAR
jgi:sodium bicarbonate transporter 10